MQGWNTQKPTQLDGNDTTILSHHSCVYAHHKTLYVHIGLFTPTKWMHNYTPRHSALLTPQPSAYKTAPYVPCSAATNVHNITDTPTCHTDSELLMHSTASAYKTDHICHAQQQLSCSHPQHDFSTTCIMIDYTSWLPRPTVFLLIQLTFPSSLTLCKHCSPYEQGNNSSQDQYWMHPLCRSECGAKWDFSSTCINCHSREFVLGNVNKFVVNRKCT